MIFWEKVQKCNHEWSDYIDSGSCGTFYCRWVEFRCKKCKVYFVQCPCGFNNSYNGWNYRRLLLREIRNDS